MTINLELSTQGINSAINRLKEAQENLRFGIKDLIDILLLEGAEIAQAADRSMAIIGTMMPTEDTGIILAGGDEPIIAEFGAGNATLSPSAYFEEMPDTPVYPGSYSELVGSGQYADKGYWVFGGRIYTEVPPRQGLYEAKQFVLDSAEDIAKEVIKL